MGNKIGTQVCSSEEICQLDSNTTQTSYSNEKPKYGSILRLWRFYPDPQDDLFVHTTPIDLREFSHFHDESCYIILHTFLSPELQANISNDFDSSPSSPNSKLQLSAAEVGVSAKQQLSPKGQRNSFGGIHSIAKSLQRPELNKYPVHYDIYIWHGIETPSLVKANTLAKGFEIDEALKNMSHTKTLSSFYEDNPTIFPISSFLQLGDTLEEWKRQSEGNHLFLWISKLYFPAPPPTKSSSPPTSKRSENVSSKKSRSNLMRGSISNCSHSVLPTNKTTNSNSSTSPAVSSKRIRKLARKGKEGKNTNKNIHFTFYILHFLTFFCFFFLLK